MTAPANPEPLHRYPGAQPFQDSELSRQTFFARDQASAALADQILASRLVIVYARSGSGKTSLLNAGVAWRLREAGCMPLFVRVNDLEKGPTAGVLEDIQSEVTRQGVEYVAGNPTSLWSFFKTVEFWREDILLRPVLIIDQFEELFTLQKSAPRDQLLSELGALLRGDAPPGGCLPSNELSATPPVIHVVLSLREDFLGLLEEASEQIPEIMDNRFRLTPLTADMAGAAITGPAGLKHHGLATQAFELTPECVTSIIDYLSRSTLQMDASRARHVEPFHLQLVCQHIESVAQARQALQPGKVRLTLLDIGGERALGQTLKAFYRNAILSLPKRYRRRAGRMCEQFLISREGRRLSVDERELCRGTGVTTAILRQLAERKLLRTDRRSDRTYYELGHDTLVQPVLATRRMEAFLLYRIAVFAGSSVTLGGIALFAVMAAVVFLHRTADDMLFGSIVAAIALAVAFLGILWARSGARRRARFRQQTVFSDPDSKSKVAWPKRVFGWLLLMIGPPICLTGALFLLVGVFGFSIAAYGRAHPGSHADAVAKAFSMFLDLMQSGTLRAVSWWVLDYAAIGAFGWFLFYLGDRILWPDEAPVSSETWRAQTFYQPLFLISGTARFVLGLLAANLAAMGAAAFFWCDSLTFRAVAAYVRFAGVLSDCIHACQAGFTWVDYPVNRATCSFLGLTFIAGVMALVWLGTGVVDLWRDLRLRINTTQTRNLQPILIPIVLLLAFLPPLKYLWAPLIPVASSGEAWVYGPSMLLHTTDGGRTWNQLPTIPDTIYELTFASPDSGWAVGSEQFWHTKDGGQHWKPEPMPAFRFTGPMDCISFATPQLGMAWGGQRSLPAITNDGGLTWTETKPLPETGRGTSLERNLGINALAFVDPQHAFILSADEIWRSQDGGLNWTQQFNGNGDSLFDLSFANPDVGWVVGANGVILKTFDGGATWRRQRVPIGIETSGIAALSPFSAIVTTRSSDLLRTDDGGTTWKLIKNPISDDFRINAVVPGSPQSAWALVDQNMILHTDDYGHTWNLQKTVKDGNLRGLAVVKR